MAGTAPSKAVGLALLAASVAFATLIPFWSRAQLRVSVASGPLPAPAEQDRGDLCADVGDKRVCWGGGLRGKDCRDGVCLVERPVPKRVVAAAGWRCGGEGASRVCEDRGHDSGSFACDDQGTCTQREPRLPDDGEWECVEPDGVVYCRRTAVASGVVEGRRDLGWRCGSRRGGARGELVCVDLAPDRPDARSWRCSYRYSGGGERVCVTADSVGVGGACSSDSACPADARCVANRCVPPRPEPACWLDTDCGAGGRCRWGTCAGGGA